MKLASHYAILDNFSTTSNNVKSLVFAKKLSRICFYNKNDNKNITMTIKTKIQDLKISSSNLSTKFAFHYQIRIASVRPTVTKYREIATSYLVKLPVY